MSPSDANSDRKKFDRLIKSPAKYSKDARVIARGAAQRDVTRALARKKAARTER